jgi:hypothetical protein
MELRADEGLGPALAELSSALEALPDGLDGPFDPPDLDQPEEDVEVRCHARATSGRMPACRYMHSSTCVAERLVVFGGKGTSGALGDLHVLDMATSTWLPVRPTGDVPAPRYGHTAIACSGSLLVFGGMAKGNSTFSFAHDDDAPAPQPRSPFGRGHGRAAAERHQGCDDSVHSLDLTTLAWTQLAPSGAQQPTPRYKHSATAIPMGKGRIRMYVFGGCDDEQIALNDQYMLDCERQEWSEVSTRGSQPSPRFGHTATLLGGRKLLVLGGSTGAARNSTATVDLDIAPHRTARTLCAMCVRVRAPRPTRSGRAAAVPPRAPPRCAPLRRAPPRRAPDVLPRAHPTRRRATRRTLHLLDIDTLTWSQPKARGAGTGAEPSPRCFHAAALCGKNLFVLGGQVQAGLLSGGHYVHGAYVLESTQLRWEHNTIKGDSFIPYAGASLLGHSASAADSSSLHLALGIVESASGVEYSRLLWDVATDAKQKLNPSLLPRPTEGGTYSTTFKLLCVGDAGVGKTSLISRFVDDAYAEASRSTIGIDFRTLQLEMDGRPVALQLWDTAGQERFRSLTAAYYRGVRPPPALAARARRAARSHRVVCLASPRPRALPSSSRGPSSPMPPPPSLAFTRRRTA